MNKELKMNNPMSEAAMLGWHGGSVEPAVKKAEATVELEYLDNSSAAGARIFSLEMHSARLKERESTVQAYIGSLMAERGLSAPFDWVLAKVQLALLKRKGRRTEEALADARGDLGRLREWADARLELLVSEVKSAYNNGSGLREITRQPSKVGTEQWDELKV